ncbi:JAB domain-containing protein [Klebsiella quasipneumoniae]
MSQAAAHPREVVKASLKYNATAVIVATVIPQAMSNRRLNTA